VSFEDFIQKSMKGLLGLGFKDFWAYYPTTLLMLLASATLIAVAVAVVVIGEGRHKMLDWHSQRGLSFLQLGLREIERLCYQHLPNRHLQKSEKWAG
jgi:hypothetical protein